MDEVLTGKVVCPTAQGHLLVRDPATLSAFLWNPRNRDKIHLPPLRGMDDSVLMHSHCLLSDEPTAPGCVVLLVEPGDACIWYVHLGVEDEDGRSWARHDYAIGEPVVLEYDDDGEPVYDKNLICPIAACRGKFYFNSFATELGMLEFCPSGPVFSSIEVDNTIAADGSYGYGEEDNRPGFIHLVESDGELYMVTLLCRGTAMIGIYGASVHRMDFAEWRWRVRWMALEVVCSFCPSTTPALRAWAAASATTTIMGRYGRTACTSCMLGRRRWWSSM